MLTFLKMLYVLILYVLFFYVYAHELSYELQ